MTVRSAFARLVVLALVAASPAQARTWVLPVAGPADPSAGELPAPRWTLESGPDGRAVPVARNHSLAPLLSLEGTTRTELWLPCAGTIRMTALGVGSSDTGRWLPVGQARAITDAEVPTQLLVTDSWLGVDELFELRPRALKHDLQVHEEAVRELGGGELVVGWSVEVPEGLQLSAEGPAGLVLRDGNGGFYGRVPAPLVADASDRHWQHGLAGWELEGEAPAWTLRLRVDRSWVDDPARSFPLRLDPTFTLQPFDEARTGFVDEFDQVLNGSIDSGSLQIIFSGGGPTGTYGMDCRGFAEFDTSTIPDTSRILSVRLQVWLSNHGNPGREAIEDPVQPLEVQVKQTLVQPTAAPPALLWMNIGDLDEGPVYVSEVIPETGDQWCADSYVFRDWDLGLQGRDDLRALLPGDFFTVGFVSEVGVDTGFDHVDWVGFPESGLGGFGCPSTDLPGSRITLVVETDAPPVCDAGGPHVSDCPSEPILLDGSASFDPDDDPFVAQWTTDCPGTIVDPGALVTELLLDGACDASCTATLTLTQDFGPTEDLVLVSCSTSVEVSDSTPPVVVSSALDGLCLWPPRHDGFVLGDPATYVEAVDSCSDVSFEWLGCVSDQPDEAREDGRPENGDGHFPNDCQVLEDGGVLRVRVERAGNDPEGRRYGLLLRASDACGNETIVEGTAHVPHDRRGGSGGPEDPCLRGDRRK